MMHPQNGRIRRLSLSLCQVYFQDQPSFRNVFHRHSLTDRHTGAFTPTCSVSHLPPYLSGLSELKSKGVDIVAVLASNDPFVMSAWRKANSVKDNVLFLSDPEAAFSHSIGWTAGSPASIRTARYAIVIDHGKVIYAGKEEARGVTVSGLDEVLKHL